MGSDDPLKVALLVAGDAAFFAVDRVVGEAFQQLAGDQFLGANVEVELDIVGRKLVDLKDRAEVAPQKFRRGQGGAHRGFENRWRWWTWVKWSWGFSTKREREEK